MLPAVLGEIAAQQDEDGAVVDEAVQQDDRGLASVGSGAATSGEGSGCPVRRSWVMPEG